MESKLVFLGSGTPRIDPNRKGPCQAIVHSQKAYLVDCGLGSVHQTALAYQQGITELKPTSLQHLFLTHLHSDHCLGLPGLILAPWVVGRTDPIHIFGPPGTHQLVNNLLAAFKEDIFVRTSGLESASDQQLKPIVSEIKPGIVFKNADLRVEAFLVHHGNWPHAFGFSFFLQNKKIVFSGDTNPCEGIELAAKGADVLVHEAYALSAAQPEPRPGGENWPKYMKDFHTSTHEVGMLAARAEAKHLIVNHLLCKSETAEDVIAEIKSIGFNGQITVANDLDIFLL